jgi:hypothetical protein
MGWDGHGHCLPPANLHKAKLFILKVQGMSRYKAFFLNLKYVKNKRLKEQAFSLVEQETSRQRKPEAGCCFKALFTS